MRKLVVFLLGVCAYSSAGVPRRQLQGASAPTQYYDVPGDFAPGSAAQVCSCTTDSSTFNVGYGWCSTYSVNATNHEVAHCPTL